MKDEKQFGRSIDDEMGVLSADDLLALQMEEGFMSGPAPQCTYCTHTCDSATSVVE